MTAIRAERIFFWGALVERADSCEGEVLSIGCLASEPGRLAVSRPSLTLVTLRGSRHARSSVAPDLLSGTTRKGAQGRRLIHL